MTLLKRTLGSIYLLRTNGLFSDGFWTDWLMFFSVSLAQSPNKFQLKTPLNNTDYMLNQIQQFQYISITQLAVYISSVYWYHKNLLINNFKWFTHSCIHIVYVCMYYIEINKTVL